tara:strand:+ start:525 stop:1028 length:504 start_codon:yes stop_codon:yes gene_type:complete
MNCSLCNNGIPQARIDMGYTICTNCSTEDKVSCHTIYPHKTGGYIQVVSKEQSENLNRLDRRGVGGIKTAKHYKEFKIDTIDEPKPVKFRRCTKVYTPYDTALDMVLSYYEEWGYERTLQYLRQMNSSGDIPLATRVKIQDIVTDKYLTPSPRTLMRHFNNKQVGIK